MPFNCIDYIKFDAHSNFYWRKGVFQTCRFFLTLIIIFTLFAQLGRPIAKIRIGEDVSVQVLAIRSSRKSGVYLAKKYEVSTSTICDIRKGYNWKHLPIDKKYRIKNHAAKLTKEDVIEIRKSKERSKILAEKYGVNPRTISSVRFGHTWKHI